MKKILTLIGSICFFILTVEAVTVTKTVNILSPGTLQSLLTENEIETVTNLTLIGSINARDIFFIRDSLLILERLDMSGTTIAEFSDQTGSRPGISKKLNTEKRIEVENSVLRELREKEITADIKKSPAELIVFPANTIPDDGFNSATTIENIVLPANLTVIGASAFYNTSFETITLPNTLTTIGFRAFGESSLTALNLPASVNNIGKRAFLNMDYNMGFFVNGANNVFSSTNGVLYSKDGKSLIAYPLGKTNQTFSVLSPVTVIGDYAFYGESDLVSVSLPNYLDTLGNFAFADCNNLSNLPFPASIRFLGNCVISWTDIQHADLSACTQLVKIGDYAFQSAYFEQFTLPYTVTSIGYAAFSLCPNLTRVDLSGYQELQVLGDYSFWECENLTELTLSGSVVSIGYCFIYDCSALTNIIVPENNQLFSSMNGNLYNKNKSKLVYYSPGKPEIAFDVPESVLIIGQAAFSGCKNLMNISTGITLQRIEWAAFYNCDTLQAVLLNSTLLTSIDNYAFRGAYNLKLLQVVSPTPPTVGGSYIFDEIDMSLCFLVVQAGAKAAYQGADYWNHFYMIEEGVANKTKVVIAASPGTLYSRFNIYEKPAICNLIVTGTIDARDFLLLRDEMPCLMNLDLAGASIAQYTGSKGTGYIPAKRSNISGNRSFNAKRHEHITGKILDRSESDAITSVAHKAPASLSASIYYPANEIPEYAFLNPDTWESKGTLQNISLPGNLKGIGEEAFALTNITSMNFPNTLTFIGDYAFEYSSMESFNFPANLNKIGYLPFYCSFYNTGFTVAGANTAFSSQDGVLFSKDKSLLIAYPLSRSATSYTIPSTVTAIDTCAFYTATDLINVSFPTSLRRINYSAFEETGLRQLDLSLCNQLTSIELWAFSTTDLTSLFLPSSLQTIGKYAFSYIPNLTNVDLSNCTSLTTLGIYAFCGNSAMARISLPVSLKVNNTGYGLFVNCESLTEILVPESGAFLTSYQGDLYNKNKTIFVSYATGKTNPIFVIPESVTRINDYAFNGTLNLKTISTGTKVDTINYRAFSYCDNLEKLSINGTSVKFMEELSVGYDPSLRLLQINSAIPPTLESNVFEGTDQYSCELNVPVGAVAAYTFAEQWNDFYQLAEYSFTELKPVPDNQIFLPTLVSETFQTYGLTGVSSINIFNPDGKTVLSTQIYNNESVNISQIAKGFYFVKVISEDGSQVMGKIIKK